MGQEESVPSYDSNLSTNWPQVPRNTYILTTCGQFALRFLLGSYKLETIEDDDYSVQVTINNVMYKVSKNLPVSTSLNTFIRNVAKLKGTKAMCLEGGCGACIVAAETNGNVMSVNSCLVPIFICDGWKITTIEGLGNRKTGYHTLQAALADMNGSQCGFCSPGWVMNMYSVSKDKKLSMEEIENSFSSNIEFFSYVYYMRKVRLPL